MYAIFFKHILNPFFENILKRRKSLAYRKLLEKSQWQTREELSALQWESLQKLLIHANAHVPFWRSRFEQMKITPDQIKSYEDFLKIPLTERSDIKQHKPEMLAENYKGKTWTKHTGGSTGAPLEIDYTPESFDWRVATSKRGYGWAGCEDGMKQFYLWGVPLEKQSTVLRLKEKFYYRLFRQKYFNCYVFDNEIKAKCIEEINRYKPEIIIGYTNPVCSLSEYVNKHGGLTHQPKAIISAAEKLHDYQREIIESAFGAKVFNTYGSREFMLIASECEEHEGLHVNVENLLVEILDKEGKPVRAGAEGELVITDLHNYGMPFIRYKVGDLAVASSEKSCLCKRGLPLIKDISGRTLDVIRTSDGKELPGEFFIRVMREHKGVDRFRVVQKNINSLIIEIIKNDQFDDNQFNLIQKNIKAFTGEQMQLTINFVNELPLTKTGKFRVTVSRLGDI